MLEVFWGVSQIDIFLAFLTHGIVPGILQYQTFQLLLSSKYQFIFQDVLNLYCKLPIKILQSIDTIFFFLKFCSSFMPIKSLYYYINTKEIKKYLFLFNKQVKCPK